MTLSCDVTPLAAELPLFPGQRQRWLMALVGFGRNSGDDATQTVRAIFQRWVTGRAFPGPIGEPQVSNVSTSIPTFENVAAVAPDEFPLPLVPGFVVVAFDYSGTATVMPWPTFAQHRRERLDPMCQVPPYAAFPLVVARANRANEGDDVLPGLGPALDDPLDLGLPPLPSLDDLATGLAVAAVVAVSMVTGYLVLTRR